MGNYEEYFVLDGESSTEQTTNEQSEPTPSETPPATEPAAEAEPKDDFTEQLKDMLHEQDIPSGMTREDLKNLIKDREKFEKEKKELAEAREKLAMFDKNQKEYVEMLTAKEPKYIPQEELDLMPEGERTAYETRQKNWNKYKAATYDETTANLNRGKSGIPDIGLQNQLTRENLEKLSLRQRTDLFEKLGLVKEKKHWATEGE